VAAWSKVALSPFHKTREQIVRHSLSAPIGLQQRPLQRQQIYYYTIPLKYQRNKCRANSLSASSSVPAASSPAPTEKNYTILFTYQQNKSRATHPLLQVVLQQPLLQCRQSLRDLRHSGGPTQVLLHRSGRRCNRLPLLQLLLIVRSGPPPMGPAGAGVGVGGGEGRGSPERLVPERSCWVILRTR
jgi:hypothetical protein